MMWLPQSGSTTTDIPLWRPQLKHDENNSIGNMISYEDIGSKFVFFTLYLMLVLQNVLLIAYITCVCRFFIAVPTIIETTS